MMGYALVAYMAFLAGTGWSVAFLAGWGIDGPAGQPPAVALAVDGGLLLLFAVQHSVMARAGFKRRLARVLPAAAERSTFVLASSLLLLALIIWWQPVPAVVWEVGLPWSAGVWAVYAAGWALVVWSTFMVDHADFLGLKQAYRHRRGLPYTEPRFTRRWLYRWCRHPMMLGLLVVFWATPRMTVGHLFFAVASTGYILVGIRFEERDLRRRYGEEYNEYARQVRVLRGARSG